MLTSMLGKRIHKARQARGFSLRQLAEKIDISHNAIKKYEHGEATPSSTILLKLANILNVKVEYFFRSNIESLKNIQYRQHGKISSKDLERLKMVVEEYAERRLTLSNIMPTVMHEFDKLTFPRKSITSMLEIEEMADELRDQWSLGTDAIPNLIETLEQHGIWVVAIKTAKNNPFDGLIAMYKDTPMIVIDEDCPGDRQRFTLAHELGHLHLENISITMNIEEACNRFAGALLLPQKSVLNIFGHKRTAIELAELKLVKDEFGISMAGILHRLKDLSVISKRTYSTIRATFKKNNWLKKEPGLPCPRESIYHFQQHVFHALAEDLIGESKAAELMNMTLTEFQSLRLLESVNESRY